MGANWLDNADRFHYNIIVARAAMAQQVEHVLGKDEVTGSSPVSSSKQKTAFVRLVVIRKFTRQPIDRAEQRKSVMDQKSMTDFLYVSLFKICYGENKE